MFFFPWIFLGVFKVFFLSLGRAACPGKYLIEGHRPEYGCIHHRFFGVSGCQKKPGTPRHAVRTADFGGSTYTLELAYPRVKLKFL